MLILKQLNLRFVCIMLLYGGVVFFIYRDEVLASLLAPVAKTTALITSVLVNQFGMEALQQDTVLIHPNGFSYEVAYSCTGVLPVATFIVCILAYPAPMNNRWTGIMIGVPVLLLVNYLRLANLFYIGVYFPGAFRLAHEVIWEGLLAISFIGLWLSWIYWSGNHQNNS